MITKASHAIEPERRRGPAQRNNHQSVVETLARRIVERHYPEGEQIPAVEALALEFGVSRTAIREALRVLSAKGFIESKQRAGTRVRRRGDWSLLDGAVLHWLFTGNRVEDLENNLLALRRMLEPEAAALAAVHGTGMDVARLESAYTRMKTSLAAGDIEECCRADVDFHVALFATTRNVFLEQLGHSIRAALLITFETSTRLADSHAESMSMHGAIIEDIRRRDPVAARANMNILLGLADKHLHGGSAARDAPPRA